MGTLLETFVVLIAVLANIITAGRLISYRRGLSRYRPGMAFLAWALIASSGGAAIDTVINGAPVSVPQAVLAVVIAVLVWRAKGNVADIVRCRHA